MKPMSQRQSRVAEEIRHVVATALLRGDIPTTLPNRAFTVTGVWVSADLRLARVFLELPQNLDETQTLAAADAQLAKPLRKILAQQARLKNTPALSFHPAREA
jgi:ribosome-binding factor A